MFMRMKATHEIPKGIDAALRFDIGAAQDFKALNLGELGGIVTARKIDELDLLVRERRMPELRAELRRIARIHLSRAKIKVLRGL